MIPGMENYEEGNEVNTPAIGSNKFAVLFTEDFYICGVQVCNSDLRLLLKPGDLICCQYQPIGTEEKAELEELSRIPNIEVSITYVAYLGYVGSERPKQASLAPCYAPDISKYLETKGISLNEFEVMRYPNQEKAIHPFVPSPYGALPGISGPFTDQVSDIQIASNIAARAVSVTSLKVENAESFLYNPKEVEIANIVVKVLSQTVNIHLQDTLDQNSSSQRNQKKDSSGSQAMLTRTSRRRTPSPANRSSSRKSRSPKSSQRTRSRSPRKMRSPRRSPSLKRKRRSPSPKRAKRSPSPKRVRRSQSPKRARRQPSPSSSTRFFSQFNEAPPRVPPFQFSSTPYIFSGPPPSFPSGPNFHYGSNLPIHEAARHKKEEYERILQREAALKNTGWDRQQLQEREAKEKTRMLEAEREQICLQEQELEKIRKIEEERMARIRREAMKSEETKIWERREDRNGSQEINGYSSNMFEKDQSASKQWPSIGMSLPAPVASRFRESESNSNASGTVLWERDAKTSYARSYDNRQIGGGATNNEQLWTTRDQLDASSQWNAGSATQDRGRFDAGASPWSQHLDYSSGNRFAPYNDVNEEPARNKTEKFPSPKPMRLTDSPPYNSGYGNEYERRY